MSGFIVRDYLSPARSLQANRIAIKNLYKEVLGTTVIGGIPVLNRHMYIYGVPFFTETKDGIRYDHKFNRLMSKLGIQHKDLVNSDYGKVENVYLYLDQNKLKFTAQEPVDLVQKFNAYYDANKDREFVDVRFTVGGQYRNAVYVNNVELTLQSANLPALRTEIEGNIERYLMGGDKEVSSVPAVYTKTGSLMAPTIGVEYNDEVGNPYDIIAILDNGSLFEVVNPCMNEQLKITEISSDGITAGSGRSYIGGAYVSNFLNMEYTYTKRYKLKRGAAVTDVAITRLKSLSDNLAAALLTPADGLSAIMQQKSYSANSDVLTELLYNINDDGADAADFYNGHLRLDAFERMKPSEFVKLLGDCMETGYTKKKVKWWKKALAIIIVIIAIIIAVVVFIYSGGTSAQASAATIAAAVAYAAGAAGLFLALAGMAYAKHVGDEWGMKVIGGAAQVSNIVGSVAGITAVYLAPSISALQATNAVLGAANLAVKLDIIDVSDKTEKALMIAQALTSIGISYKDFTSNTGKFAAAKAGEGLSSIACRNVSGFLDTLTNGLSAAAMIDQWNAEPPDQVTEDQPAKEDGVSAVYVMQEKAYKNDALETLEEMKYLSYGVNKTDMIKQNAYGV